MSSQGKISSGSQPLMTRIVILGGGFAGVTTARCLEQLCKHRRDVEIVGGTDVRPEQRAVCGDLDHRQLRLGDQAFGQQQSIRLR